MIFVGSIVFPSCELSQTGTYSMTATNSSGSTQRLVLLTVRKEEDEDLQTSSDTVIIQEPVPVKEFGDYVARLHSNDNKLFKSQFTVSK